MSTTAGARKRSRCPSPKQLTRASSLGLDADLRAHLEECETCAREWRQTQELIAAGRRLPHAAPDAARSEQLRTALLIAAGSDRAAPRPERTPSPRPWRWGLAATAVAAALALALGLRATFRSGSTPRAELTDRRASIHAAPGAHYVHTSATTAGVSHDEVVRLSEGQLDLDVAPLAEGERFRVITSDAEVEVTGTSFEVDVVDDRLAEVAVHTGEVEIRRVDSQPMRLFAGDRWTATPTRAEITRSDLPLPAADPEPADSEAAASAPVTVASTPPIADHPAPAAAPEPTTATPDRPAARRRPRVAIARTAPVTPVPAPTEAEADSDAPPEPAEEAPTEPEPEPAPPTPTEQAFQSGWTALRSGNYGEAADAFGRAIAMDPGAALSEDARYWKAVALARAGRGHDARRALAAYLAKHPGSARAGEASVMLGWLELEAGRVEAARARFQSATSDRNRSVRDSARAGLAALPR